MSSKMDAMLQALWELQNYFLEWKLKNVKNPSLGFLLITNELDFSVDKIVLHGMRIKPKPFIRFLVLSSTLLVFRKDLLSKI